MKILKIALFLAILFNLFSFELFVVPKPTAQAALPPCPPPNPITKSSQSVPPGNPILPGDDMKVTLTFQGGCSNIRGASDVMFVLDRTGSMNAPWGTCSPAPCTPPTKLESAKRALKSFVDQSHMDGGQFDPGDYIGFATYSADFTPGCKGTGVNPSGGCVDTSICSGLTDCATVVSPFLNMSNPNKTTLKTAIDSVTAVGGTTIGAGLRIGNSELTKQKNFDDTRSPKRIATQYMILATDGNQNTVPSPFEMGIINDAISKGFVVFTIAVGDDAVNIATPIGTYCSGCPDGTSSFFPNPDGKSSGEEVMKDIACRTDIVDADATKRCNSADKANTPGVNNAFNPRNYFFANNDAALTAAYDAIAGRIKTNNIYHLLEYPNLCSTPGNPASCTSANVFIDWYQLPGKSVNYPGPDASIEAKDCNTGLPYANATVIAVGQDYFLMRINGIPTGTNVCVSFVAKVRDDPAFITLLAGAGLNFILDDPRSIAAAVSPFISCTRFNIAQCFLQTFVSPQVPVSLGTQLITSPAVAWLQTNGGNVGSFTDMHLRRNLDLVSAATKYNTEFLGLSQGLLESLPTYSFRSKGDSVSPHQRWLLQNYQNLGVKYASDKPALVTGNTIYNKLLTSYQQRCQIATFNTATPTPANIDTASVAGCNMIRYTGGGGLSINWAPSQYSGKPTVIFTPGNLVIRSDLIQAASTGLIFIVGGRVSLLNVVNRVDGLFFSDGSFITSQAACGAPPTLAASTLNINGGVYMFGNGAIGNVGGCFTKVLANNFSNPSEQINFDPKYFYLFSKIVGDSRPVYQELAP